MFSNEQLSLKLVEGMGEVSQALAKCQLYGWDLHFPGYGRNVDRLSMEIGDLMGIIDMLPIDWAVVHAYRKLKADKMSKHLPTLNATTDAREMRFDERAPATRPVMPSPTPWVTKTLEFNAIFNVVKGWDIGAPEYYSGYMGGNGSHAFLIYNALDKVRQDAPVPKHHAV